MGLECVRRHRSFGGTQTVYRHESLETGTPMEVAIYMPPRADEGPCPVLCFLSGLTCTWANFTEKAGAQRSAAEHGLILVCPDTSPRGTNLPGEHERYDFGSGAGFYVDAVVPPWSAHYRMYSYIVEELPQLLAANFPVDLDRQGLCGHSMGGHGALTIAFKNAERYRSLSAFAPIVAPSQVPWGETAFGGYLGADRTQWLEYDACALVGRAKWRSEILVDQGLADEFLDTQLRPELFERACAASGTPLTLRRHADYDHGYYFIATFIGDHVAHHARLLRET